MAAPKVDVYEIVTNQILDALENGTVAWHKPWVSMGGHRNLNSKRPYSGINAFLLALTPFKSPFWMTYKGAQKLGGQVKKGEKGTIVVFWTTFKVEDPKNPGKEKTVPYLKYYRIWNLDQVEGIDESKIPTAKDLTEHDAIEEAQAVLDNMVDGPEFVNGGDRACYAWPTDTVTVPAMKQFESPESYYSTCFHEYAHATGHGTRLARDGWNKVSFGSDPYAAEELVAEMTAAMVAGTIGMDTQVQASAAYIQGWLKTLRNDKKMVIRAASQAQKAANRILGVEPAPYVKEETA